MPLTEPTPKSTSRFQFRLSYLVYVLTLFAFGSALIRFIVAIHYMWSVTILEILSVIVFVSYFAIRFPILVRRWMRGSDRVAQQKRELHEMAAKLRERKNSDQEDA